MNYGHLKMSNTSPRRTKALFYEVDLLQLASSSKGSIQSIPKKQNTFGRLLVPSGLQKFSGLLLELYSTKLWRRSEAPCRAYAGIFLGNVYSDSSSCFMVYNCWANILNGAWSDILSYLECVMLVYESIVSVFWSLWIFKFFFFFFPPSTRAPFGLHFVRIFITN